MAKTLYDMVKLEALDDIDVGHAVDNGGYQAFFDELDWFVDLPKKFFSDYNPAVVVCDNTTRIAFLEEVSTLREKFTSLGLFTLVLALTDLEEAVEMQSVGGLSDWIISLQAKAEQLEKMIAAARVGPVKPRVKRTGKPVILAVDDKPELLTVLVNMLKDKYTVMAATGGMAAIKIIDKHNPELFLLDIEMPKMDGYQLAKIIRERKQFADVPIIFLTGKGTRNAVITAVNHGGNDYIVKPVDKDILIDKIGKYLM